MSANDPAGAATSNGEPGAIGIIGVGLMGGALMKKIGEAGFMVRGWDRDGSRCAGAGSAAEVFDRCDRVFLCLPDSAAARAVLEEAALRAGQVVIDTSTGDPAEMAALGADLAARGVHYLDATISGSSAQVLERDVLVMAGGDPDVFERCRDLFAAFAREAMNVGPCGSGAKMKLVTNLVLGLNRAALAEGLAFARQLGLDPGEALGVMRRSMAASRIMDTKGGKMVALDFTPQAKLAQHLKDVRLMLAATPLPLPLTEAHCRLLEKAVALGYGDLDNSAVIKVIQPPSA
jgi:3-hydroxyisobutyrate dehydrogenase-like beta-hydroxyacid dehydrogenase